MAQSVGSVSVDVVPDASRFRRELDAKLKGLKANIGLDADVAKLRTKIQAALKNKARMTVHVDANMTKFNAKIKRALKARDLVLNVDLDAGTAEAEIDAIARDRKTTVEVDADTAGATAQITALNSAASSGGRSMRGLTVAALALGPALVPVTAAVGGLVAALSAPLAAAGGGLSTLMASVAGNVQSVLKAQKDLTTAQDKAKAAADSYASAQQGVASAMEGVKTAQRSLADAQINANRGVQSALESLAQTRRDASRSEQSARQSLASAIQSANTSVASAESSLASAQDRARSAQEALNDAREAARQKLADYDAQLKGAALNESGAKLAIRQAQQSLNDVLGDPKSTQLQIDLARQALKEARYNYQQAKKDRSDLRKQAAEDRKQGIKGDEDVRDARDDLADANRDVRDAEKELARTRVQAAQDVAQARKAVVQARVDGAREIAQAERSVEQARVDGARAVAAAQAGVTSANRQLSVAQAAAADAGSDLASAQGDVANAMGRLGGPAAGFVKALERAKGAWSRFLGATRGPALGLASKALGVFIALMPKLAPLANAAADAVGDLLSKFGRFVRGGGADKVIDWLTKATGPAIRSLGTIFGNIAVGLGGMIGAFKPLGDALLDSLERLTGRFAKFGQTASSNKGVKGFIDYVRKSGPLVTQFFADLVTIGVELGKALAPIGIVILKAFRGLADVLKRTPTEVLTVISAGIMGIVTATWAWNIALRANPIGLVVGALVALGAGLVLAYKKSETFRKIVNAAWRGIRKAAQVTWQWMKGTLWPGIKRVFGWIGARAKWLWKNAIGPAFRAISKFVTGELMPIIRRLWRGVIQPAFKGIGTVVRDAWNGVIKPALKALWWFIKNVLAPVVTWLWKHVVAPAFRRIGKIIGVAWNYGIKPILNRLISFFENTLYPVFRFLYKKVVKPIFNRISNWIESTWEDGIKPTFVKVKDWIEDLIGWAQKLIDKLNDIKPGGEDGEGFGDMLLRKGKETIVPGSGIINLFRASGGPVRGPGTSTSDSIPAMLSNGEYVVSADAVNKYGLGFFEAANAKRLAEGGAANGERSRPGNVSRLVAAIWALVRELRRSLKSTTTTTTDTKPSKDIGTAIHSGDNKGGTLHPVVKGGGSGSLHPVVKGPKFDPGGFESITTGFKKQIQVAQSWEQAVGKSAKKAGKFWTEVRYGPFRRFSDDWKKRLRIAGKNTNDWEKTLGKNARQSGRTLDGFRRSTLAPFARDFGNRFARELPDDMGTFRSKTTTQFGKTSDSMRGTWSNRVKPMLRDFGSYPRASVAPAFAKGVDAIGGQWEKVQKATGKPVKFVVDTVLNKGLLAAFNKIAKFVDTDTIKNIELPKFRRGGKVWGAGTETSDSIPARLSKNEHVWTAREVRGAGGHQAMEQMRAQARQRSGNDNGMRPPRGRRNKRGIPGFWVGGGVFPLPGGALTNFHGTNYESSWWAGDLNGPGDDTGMPIIAWKKGRVVEVSHNIGSYGNETVINHDDGNWTRYAHQLSQAVNAGDMVRKGERIGRLGGTGNVTGPHLHFEIGGGKADYQGGTGTGGPSLPKWAQTIMQAPKKWAKGLLADKMQGDGFKGVVQGMLDKLIAPSADWATKQLGTFGPSYNGPMTGAVTRFVPTIKDVLKSLGEPSGETLMGAILARMQKESGGNVGIVNKSDSNWLAGHPSVGLMQVIGPTYQSNKPRPDKGPYKYGTSIDPYSNIYAGLHYARGRYGSIYRGMTQPGGYDQGGLANRMGFMPKWTPKPERVLSPRQTVAFDRMVEHNFNPSGQPTAIHITSGRLDITRDGKAAIRGMAAVELSAQTQHNRTVARQGI